MFQASKSECRAALSDAWNPIQLFSQKRLIGCGTRYGYLDEVVIFPGCQIGFYDLWQFLEQLAEAFEHFLVVALQRDFDDDGLRVTQLALIQQGDIAADYPLAFKTLEPVPARCLGETRLLRDLRDRKPGILLERSKYPTVGLIEFAALSLTLSQGNSFLPRSRSVNSEMLKCSLAIATTWLSSDQVGPATIKVSAKCREYLIFRRHHTFLRRLPLAMFPGIRPARSGYLGIDVQRRY